MRCLGTSTPPYATLSRGAPDEPDRALQGAVSGRVRYEQRPAPQDSYTLRPSSPRLKAWSFRAGIIKAGRPDRALCSRGTAAHARHVSDERRKRRTSCGGRKRRAAMRASRGGVGPRNRERRSTAHRHHDSKQVKVLPELRAPEGVGNPYPTLPPRAAYLL